MKGEGTGSEKAFWRATEPKPDPQTNIQTALETHLNARVTAGDVQYARLEKLNEAQQKAIVRVIKNDLSEGFMLIDKDGGGNLRIRPIT